MSSFISPINYNKVKNTVDFIDNTTEEDFYRPFNITNIQYYNPIYSVFFDLTENNYNSITLNHKYHIKNLKEIIDLKTNVSFKKEIHVKFSPLIDPTRYMVGKYEKITTVKLPSVKKNETTNNESRIQQKIDFFQNASYIDSFFYYLSSILLNNYKFEHGIDFYGSFLGIQDKFKIDVSDDIEYLENSTFFMSHINQLFALYNWNNTKFDCKSSRKNKPKLIFNEDKCDIKINNVENIICESNDSKCEPEPLVELYSYMNKDVVEDDDEDENSSDDEDDDDEDENSSDDDEDENSSDDDEDENSSDDDEDENSSVDDDEDENSSEDEGGEHVEDDDEDENNSENEENEEEINAYINNFPVQLICMEKCDGTMDELFMKNIIDENIGISALFQIIMILIAYQRVFKFTHNDLHTNNITYVNTHHKYIYYKYDNNTYRVPTYGRIFKLIDFGRSIFKFQNRLFCSDSFSPHGDATTQYNCPPFYNSKKPMVIPNNSFDLCRLGCSIYDFIIDENPKRISSLNKFQQIVFEWCLDDKGKNLLYTKTNEEKYPGFKLYKKIARNVTKHTPQIQLENPVFKTFIFNEKTININESMIIDINVLPELH